MIDKNVKQLCALDIGSSKIVALIGEIQNDRIHIIGTGETPSRGMKNGMITNIDATSQSIRKAMDEAENMIDGKVDAVIVGIGGNHICSMNSNARVKIKDGEVTQVDIDRALENAKAVNIPNDHQVLHTIVQEYIIDNQPGVRNPLGMSGTSLDVRVHIITGAVTAIQNLEKCVQRANLIPSQIILQPLASALSVATDDDQELGVCCLDIGSGTTDITVFTGGAIRHTAVIPLGGDFITKDLTQALRTPYAAAEHIKTFHGVAMSELEGLDEMVEVPVVGDRQSRQVSRHVLSIIIQPRVEEIFEIVINELHRAGYPEEQFTAGIILTGGTSLLHGIVDLAEEVFSLPIRVGVPKEMGSLSERVRNPRYATAMGLLFHAMELDMGKKSGFLIEKEPSLWDKIRGMFGHF